jgi:hypothetical protein
LIKSPTGPPSAGFDRKGAAFASAKLATETKYGNDRMTFSEAMDEETMVRRPDAVRECERHDHDPADMFAELGDHQEYKACDVLIWLGY